MPTKTLGAKNIDRLFAEEYSKKGKMVVANFGIVCVLSEVCHAGTDKL